MTVVPSNVCIFDLNSHKKTIIFNVFSNNRKTLTEVIFSRSRGIIKLLAYILTKLPKLIVTKAKSHSYTDPVSFDRLMLLIAVLIKYPGIGYLDLDNLDQCAEKQHHDALEEVKIYLRQSAKELNIQLPQGYPATHTLRKDLELLRNYHILDRRMYRWGYYLGTGVMTKQQLKVAFNALESFGNYQGDPRIKQFYRQLSKRLKGFEFQEQKAFFYPVRLNYNRAINYTDPYEMMEQSAYRDTLFHKIEIVEQAIISGQAIEISRLY